MPETVRIAAVHLDPGVDGEAETPGQLLVLCDRLHQVAWTARRSHPPSLAGRHRRACCGWVQVPSGSAATLHPGSHGGRPGGAGDAVAIPLPREGAVGELSRRLGDHGLVGVRPSQLVPGPLTRPLVARPQGPSIGILQAPQGATAGRSLAATSTVPLTSRWWPPAGRRPASLASVAARAHRHHRAGARMGPDPARGRGWTSAPATRRGHPSEPPAIDRSGSPALRSRRLCSRSAGDRRLGRGATHGPGLAPAAATGDAPSPPTPTSRRSSGVRHAWACSPELSCARAWLGGSKVGCDAKGSAPMTLTVPDSPSGGVDPANPPSPRASLGDLSGDPARVAAPSLARGRSVSSGRIAAATGRLLLASRLRWRSAAIAADRTAGAATSWPACERARLKRSARSCATARVGGAAEGGTEARGVGPDPDWAQALTTPADADRRHHRACPPTRMPGGRSGTPWFRPPGRLGDRRRPPPARQLAPLRLSRAGRPPGWGWCRAG